MRSFVQVSLLVLATAAAAATAQTIAPGKYTGNKIGTTASGKPDSNMVTLTIEKVEGDQVQGVAWVGGKHCRVDVPAEGQLNGDVLTLTGKSDKDKCGFKWQLKVIGDKLEGKTGSGDVLNLSK